MARSRKRSSRIAAAAGVIALAFIAFTAIAVHAAENAGTRNVEVMGTGIIVRDNAPMARGVAITSGLVSAVERVIADLIPTEALISRFPAINSILYGGGENYIQGYKVLAETEHGKHYRVLVSALVDVNKVKHRLTESGILVSDKRMPKVLFLIAEERIEDLQPRYWWRSGGNPAKNATESAMAKVLKKRGFPIAAHAFLPAAAISANAGAELGTKAALALGRHYNAGLIIVGRSAASPGQNASDTVMSFTGKVSARAIRTDTGATIATVTKSATAVDTEEIAGGLDALTAAGTGAGVDLSARVAEIWRKGHSTARTVSIEVSGENYLGKFVRLRRALSTLAGVEEVRTSEMTAGKAFLAVDYKQDGVHLAGVLLRQDFGTFGINITETLPDSLKVAFTQSTGP